MTTQRDTVLDAFVSIIGTGTSAGTNVFRTRREQLPALPALMVEQGGVQSEQIVLGYTDHTMSVRLTAYANNDTPDAGADAVLGEAHARLFADPTLGLSGGTQIMPTYSVETPEVDQYDYAALAHVYQVFYRTATNAI